MALAPITLSPSAAARLHALSSQEGRPVLLRIAVDGGGCSGFQYRMELVGAGEPDDLRVEHDGAAALIDDVSQPFLAGSQIEWVDELAASEFRVRNPNAKSSCGCGVSFSI